MHFPCINTYINQASCTAKYMLVPPYSIMPAKSKNPNMWALWPLIASQPWRLTGGICRRWWFLTSLVFRRRPSNELTMALKVNSVSSGAILDVGDDSHGRSSISLRCGGWPDSFLVFRMPVFLVKVRDLCVIYTFLRPFCNLYLQQCCGIHAFQGLSSYKKVYIFLFSNKTPLIYWTLLVQEKEYIILFGTKAPLIYQTLFFVSKIRTSDGRRYNRPCHW
jgi:hypothetical protein